MQPRFHRAFARCRPHVRQLCNAFLGTKDIKLPILDRSYAGPPKRRARCFVEMASQRLVVDEIASMHVSCACSSTPLSPSALDKSVEATALGRIGRSHARVGSACPAEETGMDQQANAFEALPSLQKAHNGTPWQRVLADQGCPGVPCAQGDVIDELFAQHYGASLRTAYGILRCKEDAEDAVQTAYFAAFRNFKRFRGESTFKTWITRIVVNCCLSRLREHCAKPRVALDDLQRLPESHAVTPEMLCYLRELESAHEKATSRLPQQLKDVYAPCVIADVALTTVAHHLSLTANAAKSRLHRARRKVKRSLQGVIQRRAA